jgi:hypothetical protein
VKKHNNDKYWFDQSTKKDDMKILSATELSVLRNFVKEVIEVTKYDDTGVTMDLDDGAQAAAEILGIVYVPEDGGEFNDE